MEPTGHNTHTHEAIPGWAAPLSAIVGSAALWLVAFLSTDRLRADGIEWYAWPRLALLALGGTLGLAAAALLALRRPSGRIALQLAIGTVPLFLAISLATAAVRAFAGAAGWLHRGADPAVVGALFGRLRHSPLALANIAIVALIVVVAVWGEAARSSRARRGAHDEAAGGGR